LALCHSREQAEQVKTQLAQWLAPRGLVFNEAKTQITHLDQGVDFLGFGIRRYPNGKLLTKPTHPHAFRADTKNLLELVARKRARPVLRGPRRSNAPGLPDERWFGYLTEQKIRRGAHRSVRALETDIKTWIAAWNEDPKPFVWKKSAEEILDSLSRYLQRITNTNP